VRIQPCSWSHLTVLKEPGSLLSYTCHPEWKG